ncbi:hypothetical protein RBSH_05328 [Rhodopirellula baltica SH28]|uniref:Uncharacterized protein n=1 Tax=Rhodopirellula baltica SH28 TaxID=993517 RepID=K5C8K7_RHOBT|nr:hypothetical protein RBSH_05328 [Rhodopirellula baltica SH28]
MAEQEPAHQAENDGNSEQGVWADHLEAGQRNGVWRGRTRTTAPPSRITIGITGPGPVESRLDETASPGSGAFLGYPLGSSNMCRHPWSRHIAK